MRKIFLTRDWCQSTIYKVERVSNFTNHEEGGVKGISLGYFCFISTTELYAPLR